MSDVEIAINDMKFMRQTHIDWAVYFEKNPVVEAEHVATGKWDDAKEHRRIASQYDRVIGLLEKLL